eukprot:CAMPEP_0180754024 /NCGR_PEP_ID=MMETSP1038_2-20121128/32980_1 /TAXON_ID=632150 /ORGANISM="Azadinium spinosum, Strain 3D9" /LENGTH=180 /DNA_ID=CAMNT_0022787919 /DNA_START=281 /DNA_END=822 /DNA_ORIENTATION=+
MARKHGPLGCHRALDSPGYVRILLALARKAVAISRGQLTELLAEQLLLRLRDKTWFNPYPWISARIHLEAQHVTQGRSVILANRPILRRGCGATICLASPPILEPMTLTPSSAHNCLREPVDMNMGRGSTYSPTTSCNKATPLQSEASSSDPAFLTSRGAQNVVAQRVWSENSSETIAIA